MLEFLKFKGDQNDLLEAQIPEGLSEESEALILALLAQMRDEPSVDEFDFVFAQLSQTKEGAFDGGSLKLKFDNSDGAGEALAAEMELLLSQSGFEYEAMLVELGNGDAYFKIGYRDLPFNKGGEELPTDEASQVLADVGYDLFGA